MGKAKLFSAGAVLLAVALLFAFSFNFFDSTGMFWLSGKEESVQPEAPKETEEDSMKAGLSFTVLKPTTLEANISNGKSLSECPKETEAEILVKNAGSSIAEKMFLDFGPGIKVLACSGCLLDELLPGQEKRAKARLCLESASLQTLTVGSANSNPVELLFE